MSYGIFPLSEGPDEGPIEDLKLENELLKLKMQAELGARFGSFGHDEELPPAVERQFLEQVLAFEKAHHEAMPVLVGEYLGNPVFRAAAELSAGELECEWQRLQAVYESKDLTVDFGAEYPLATKYDFMASELLREEVLPIPGWHFIYEEFHPNHDRDQRWLTERFVGEFFRGKLSEFTMSPQIVSPGRRVAGLQDVQLLLERFHGLFDRIESSEFAILETSAQADAELPTDTPNPPRLGYSEGMLKYTAVLHDGSRSTFEGPFKLYMECVFDCWSVMHFYMHGFSWTGEDGEPAGRGVRE